jgi:hypothetical protein
MPDHAPEVLILRAIVLLRWRIRLGARAPSLGAEPVSGVLQCLQARDGHRAAELSAPAPAAGCLTEAADTGCHTRLRHVG